MPNKIKLPEEKKAKILTTETDEWIPLVAKALIKEGKTALLQCGDGPYILVGGVHVGKTGPEIMQLINKQKERPLNQLVAMGIPREEMHYWVESSHKPIILKLTKIFKDEVFGVIAPVHKRVPNWLRRFDNLHQVWEKLMVWTDKTDDGPTAKLYRYLRNNLKLAPDKFFLIASSANLHGRGTNIRFAHAYKQLRNKEDLAYAVMDVEEKKYKKGSPPIISTLPFTRGRKHYLVVNARRGIKELKNKLPELRQKSKAGLFVYAAQIQLETYLKKMAETLGKR